MNKLISVLFLLTFIFTSFVQAEEVENPLSEGSHTLASNETTESSPSFTDKVTNTFNNWTQSDPAPSENTQSMAHDNAKTSTLVLDRTLSPIVGADLMLLGLRGYQAIDDSLFPNASSDSNTGYGAFGRTGKVVFEGVISGTLALVQHEVFGHGARAREFNLPVTRYRIGFLDGSTHYSSKINQLSLSQRIALRTAGMEANSILAKQIRDRWLKTNSLDSREASLYLFSAFDQTYYILRTGANNKDTGNDIRTYTQEINQWYGRTVLTNGDLKRRALLNFLDPYLYYSLYSLGTYILEGAQTCSDYPMIISGDYRYLPAFGLSLAPYGPEYQFFNYIRTPNNSLIQATLRYGNTGGLQSYGATYETTQFWTSDLLFLDGRVDLWSQPKMFTPIAKESNRLGAAASIIARYQVADKLQLMGQLGYKTQGFIPGEILRKGLIARIGAVMQL